MSGYVTCAGYAARGRCKAAPRFEISYIGANDNWYAACGHHLSWVVTDLISRDSWARLEVIGRPLGGAS